MKNSSTKNIVKIASVTAGLIFLGIILSSSTAYALKMTEIMFNPQGSDSGSEWIEVSFNSSDGCLNLSKYKLYEENTNHNINAYRYSGYCSYAIISDNPDKFLSTYYYLNDSTNLMIEDVAIYKSTFSLSNSGENLSIKQNGSVVDEVDYAQILETLEIAEGYSIEYDSNTYSWKQSTSFDGNPGNMFIEYPVAEDNATENIEDNISDGEDTPNDTYAENTTANSTIIENDTLMNDTLNDENDTYTDNSSSNNSSSNTSSNSSENLSSDNTSSSQCNVSIRNYVKNESIIYEDGLQIKFYNKLDINTTSHIGGDDLNYSIEYWIEDLFGNIVKSKTLTNNQDEKSFTPKISETDKIFFIKSNIKEFQIEGINCAIIKNSSEKIILVKNQNYTAPKAPSCASCDCKASKCESVSSSQSSYIAPYSNVYSNCSQNPIIRTINYCNESRLNKYMQNMSQAITLDGANLLYDDNNDNIQENMGSNYASTQPINSNKLNKSNSTAQDLITGTITYESPNVKNRFYALIGMVMVGIACAMIITYRFYRSRKMENKADDDTGKTL